MSDKQERFYVVSESELHELQQASAAEELYQGEAETLENRIKAEAACRAREVGPYGFGIRGDGIYQTWVEIKK